MITASAPARVQTGQEVGPPERVQSELTMPKFTAAQINAIAAGRQTLAEHRTAERDRKQRTRANKRAAEANSGTVPESAAATASVDTGFDTTPVTAHSKSSTTSGSRPFRERSEDTASE
jgi:hypothetical protein